MSDWNYIQQQQKAICEKFEVDWTPVDINSMITFNESLLSNTLPEGWRFQIDDKGYEDVWFDKSI